MDIEEDVEFIFVDMFLFVRVSLVDPERVPAQRDVVFADRPSRAARV